MGLLQAEIQKREPFENPVHEAILSVLRTADVLGRPSEVVFAKAGLSAAQYNVLRILRGVGADGLPCGQIAQRMISRDPDMTRLLDRLERRHLITRARQQCDRRVVRAQIAPAGMTLLHDLDRPMNELQGRLLQHMTSEQISMLIHLLEVARGGSPEAEAASAQTEHPPSNCSVSKEGSL